MMLLGKTGAVQGFVDNGHTAAAAGAVTFQASLQLQATEQPSSCYYAAVYCQVKPGSMHEMHIGPPEPHGHHCITRAGW